MKKIFVAGHNGMVGSAICRSLRSDSSVHVVTRSRDELNLLCQKSVRNFFEAERFDQVYLAAAKVGGIHANSAFPAQFIYENLQIQNNIINGAHLSNVSKLLFLGSSCIYPKHAEQPMQESCLLTGKLEETNEPYAIAKIAGIKMCEAYNREYGRDYRSVMPTNLYGPGDNFHAENSHVIPALMRRIHEAKQNNLGQVVVWGSGTPKREFLHVDDMAEASIYVQNIDDETFSSQIPPMQSHINVGTGEDCSIRDLVEILVSVVDYKGTIAFDSTKPDGTPRKLLDTSVLANLGWRYKVNLVAGLQKTYEWYLKNSNSIRV